MENKPLPKQEQTEEVDLGQLFKLIGSAFSRVFNFFKHLFEGLFLALISVVLFFRNHSLKFFIAGFIGGGLGFYLDLNSESIYESKMIVEPNFNSAQQLYNNIEFYHELAKSKDSLGLQSLFKEITIKEASQILKFKVESFSDENQKVELFNNFIKKLDSSVRKTINYKDYLKNFNSLSARFHTITIRTTNPFLVKKIENSIVEKIITNEYFRLQKGINDTILRLQEDIYKKKFSEIDSLQLFYRKIMLAEAQKENLGTSINLAQKVDSENRDIALLREIDKLKNDMIRLNQDKAQKAEVINIISSFPNKGARISGLLNSKTFSFAASLIVVVLFFLVLIEINKFLKRFEEQQKVKG